MSTRNAFVAMREPASSILSKHGIKYRVKHEGGTTWYNLAKCPLCSHENYQCGISESLSADGKFIHGVKCWHIADNGFGTDTPPYEDFLYRIGELTAEEYNRIKGYVSGQRSHSTSSEQRSKPLVIRTEEPLRSLNIDFHGKLRKRLRENPAALQYLENRGISVETVNCFGLGLSTPYTSRKTGEEQADALVYPIRGRDGRLYNKYGYYNIPGVTKNPTDPNSWMSGEVRTYYAEAVGSQKNIFICEGAKDVWRHWQALRGTHLASDLLLITSTHGSAIPEEWKDPEFWTRWETVFFGHDNDEAGEHIATKLATSIGREARRVTVPKWYGKDWTDFWQSGGDVAEFSQLLDEAPVVSLEIQSEEDSLGYGRFAYKPININGAFHNGHLYYTVQTLNRGVDITRKDSGEEVVHDVERLETVVVRSDRTVHSATWVPAPKGTRDRDRVLRLSDGTLVDREPQTNKYGTWSWLSIKAYLDGRSKTRPLAEILRDVMTHLISSVWLPYEEDYAILTLTVPVTYAQAVFDSVPLIFLNGPAGSGKSEMGRAMARICANAYVSGQSSAASIARFIDESRGFVVLDDLEMIGNRGGEFSELVQALKLSYNKTTAVKLWTDVKTMRTQLLDFYGVKMINNTQGADNILSSRMLRIQTRKLPESLKKDFGELLPTTTAKLHELRDELHTWTFENVSMIEQEYKTLFPKGTDRSDEITAPLKVMAFLADDPELHSQLEVALTRQKQKAMDLDDPKEVLHEALKILIAQGYDMISITHLVLEMRSLVSTDFGKSFTNEIPEWARPEWVGRMLRSFDLIDTDPAKAKRQRVFGANLRFYPIHPRYLDEVREFYAAQNVMIPIGEREPADFCQICDTCPFRALACEIMARRQDDEKRQKGQFTQITRGH
ncbi:MAG TPA: hypothetical protein VKB86_11255 [Pyrinomonadaceae bacterium]|nr:hypothetical protein [Pyrinomonadaceae bacterium]